MQNITQPLVISRLEPEFRFGHNINDELSRSTELPANRAGRRQYAGPNHDESQEPGIA